MYHTESLSAESKLKEAEKQEEKHIGKVNDISLRYGHDDRPQRRSSVKKMEKLKEKVCFVPCRKRIYAIHITANMLFLFECKRTANAFVIDVSQVNPSILRTHFDRL